MSTSESTTAVPVASTAHGVIAPPDSVTVGGGLLGRWQARNRHRTIPHGLHALESAGNLDNLRRAAGQAQPAFRGPVFADSDVYKTLEAVAWELGHEDDAALRDFYDRTVALLEDAQQPDGYLDSAYQRPQTTRRPRADYASVAQPWTDFAFGHELYCAGHLVQAAVAGARALGDGRLLGVATRFADLIVQKFGGADSPVYPGHPEVEAALVELYRLTGRRAYLDMAAAFVDRRGAGWLGDGVFGPAYYQDDAPLRQTSIMRGHAVRALYLNSGATDVYLETGDRTLLGALISQWDDMVARRSYLTGGTGSRHRDEAFGDAYELPADRAYAETCAGIAAFQWGWRMYLATGEPTYVDVAETVLYNVIADGISESGDAFFYSNPLQLRADHISVQEEAAACRLGWYFCACCPPNLMRTFASIEAYIAGVRGDELQIVQFTTSRIRASVGGAPVIVDVDTAYPADGRVHVCVRDDAGAEGDDLHARADGDGPRGTTAEHTAGADAGTLTFRMPGWCRAVRVVVDGVAADVEPTNGWLRLPGALRPGTEVDIDFAMPVDVVAADGRVDAIRGSVAVRRGPVVYCAEQRDNVVDVDAMLVDADSAPVAVEGAPVAAHGTPVAAEGAQVEETTDLGPLVQATGRVRSIPDDAPLYTVWRSGSPAPTRPATFRLRPYATWGNGAAGGMRVWLPRVLRARRDGGGHGGTARR